jgi:hypothetical protein
MRPFRHPLPKLQRAIRRRVAPFFWFGAWGGVRLKDDKPIAVIHTVRFVHPMTTLEGLLARFSKRNAARWWLGPRPDVREGMVARTIAEQLGYPSGDHDPFSNEGMTQLTKRQAAYVLALAGTRGLAYNSKHPSTGNVEAALVALNDLSNTAIFLSNGTWKQGESCAWNSLSSATFDCGVIGYDQANGFIFWIEEED